MNQITQPLEFSLNDFHERDKVFEPGGTRSGWTVVQAWPMDDQPYIFAFTAQTTLAQIEQWLAARYQRFNPDYQGPVRLEKIERSIQNYFADQGPSPNQTNDD